MTPAPQRRTAIGRSTRFSARSGGDVLFISSVSNGLRAPLLQRSTSKYRSASAKAANARTVFFSARNIEPGEAPQRLDDVERVLAARPRGGASPVDGPLPLGQAAPLPARDD